MQMAIRTMNGVDRWYVPRKEERRLTSILRQNNNTKKSKEKPITAVGKSNINKNVKERSENILKKNGKKNWKESNIMD